MEIQHKIDDLNRGSFFINQDGRQVAELDFEVKNNILNAYHTGVRPSSRGKELRADCSMKWFDTHGKRITWLCLPALIS